MLRDRLQDDNGNAWAIMNSVVNRASKQRVSRLDLRDLDARAAVCAALVLGIVAVAMRIATIW
ncbi:hypothetical protein DU475_22030 [Rhodopseudomonas sp. WA056]|nr:hypothetical protein [Rhodopseudomonas sp. WA056]